MKKLMVVLGVLAALWLAVELVAPRIAASRIEDRVKASTSGVGSVRASVRSFPMVTRLLLTSRVERVDVTLNEVARQRVDFARVTFDLRGIDVVRNSLFSGDPKIRDIQSGSVTAVIDTGPLLGRVAGALRSFAGIDAQVANRSLLLRIGGREVTTIALPADMVPCDGQARVERDEIVVSCTFTEVPDVFVQLANRDA